MTAAPISPGEYLRRRRLAAGLTHREVAARLATTPRLGEHARAEFVAAIEGGAPARFETIVALRHVFTFDLDVLVRLAAIDLGSPLLTPRLCRDCACSTFDGCVDGALRCDWVDAATPLCTACAPARAAPAQPAQPEIAR